MLFQNITILDEEFQAREGMYVGIEGPWIDYLGAAPPQKDYGETRDGRGFLLMPGFYNAHAHSPMTLMRGYGENMALQEWLTDRIFPFEAQLDGNAVYWGTMLAMAESLRTGIVSTTDMYYFTEDMVRAVLESGAKNNISRSITNFMDEDLFDMDAGREMKEAFERFHMAGEGRVRIDMSLHAEYTSTPKTVDQLAAYTGEIGARQHVHVSETRREHEECIERHGQTPVAYLAAHGLFDAPTTAAHCVWVTDEDRRILRDKGVTVAVNPVSNLKLASGVCNVQALLDSGIGTAIGTDSVSSNNSLNFFEEMKVFAIAGKAHYNNPVAVTPADALRAATRGGALSQGREDCGLLRQGCRADLVMLDLRGPNWHPVHSLANNLVYSADPGAVKMTMVDGRVLYENGDYKTIDLERTICEVEKATDGILSCLAEVQ
ncbi:MAG: amidohydrolase family protein [Anaerovoracaceae bacterium]|jgi:5-methylthioadenosine/S-adenosylhomocysteine deaminase